MLKAGALRMVCVSDSWESVGEGGFGDLQWGKVGRFHWMMFEALTESQR